MNLTFMHETCANGFKQPISELILTGLLSSCPARTFYLTTDDNIDYILSFKKAWTHFRDAALDEALFWKQSSNIEIVLTLVLFKPKMCLGAEKGVTIKM